MDNSTVSHLFNETADLMEIDGADSFRVRSYRRAAEAVEQTTVDVVSAAGDTAMLLGISGIGKSMLTNIQAIVATGSMPLRDQLLTKYGAGLLELLKLPSMGPKTVALLWDAGRTSKEDGGRVPRRGEEAAAPRRDVARRGADQDADCARGDTAIRGRSASAPATCSCSRTAIACASSRPAAEAAPSI